MIAGKRDRNKAATRDARVDARPTRLPVDGTASPSQTSQPEQASQTPMIRIGPRKLRGAAR